MTVQELKRLLEAEPETALVVDVREMDEVEEAPLLPVGTRGYVNLPLSLFGLLPAEEMRTRLGEAAVANGRVLGEVRLVMSCRSGNRSAMAQKLLAQQGIASENLEGGYLAWQGRQ